MLENLTSGFVDFCLGGLNDMYAVGGYLTRCKGCREGVEEKKNEPYNGYCNSDNVD